MRTPLIHASAVILAAVALTNQLGVSANTATNGDFASGANSVAPASEPQKTVATSPLNTQTTTRRTTPTTSPDVAAPAVADPRYRQAESQETTESGFEQLPRQTRTLESSFVSAPIGAPIAALPEPVCVDGTDAHDLTTLFADGDLVVGADYQRAYPLPTGRVLWLFQDAFLSTSHGPELVHNIGLLQSGSCFQLLRTGTTNSPRPYLFPELSDRFDRWFWPLGGEIGNDEYLHVFVAEFWERGPHYLAHSEPVATWLVTIDPVDLTVIDQQPAGNPTHELYGWSVTSHGEHTYLYAHCYRQFGWDPFPFADPPARAHDWDCSPNVTVARIPRGQFSSTPEYWSGTTWTGDPAKATPVFPTEDRAVNPVQVAVLDGRFIAVTKVGDWFGTTIHLDVAPAPQGPWQTYDTVAVKPECDVCNTYFASIVPYGADDQSFLIGLSNNTWGGHDLGHYQPTFQRVRAPVAIDGTTAATEHERRSVSLKPTQDPKHRGEQLEEPHA